MRGKTSTQPQRSERRDPVARLTTVNSCEPPYFSLYEDIEQASGATLSCDLSRQFYSPRRRELKNERIKSLASSDFTITTMKPQRIRYFSDFDMFLFGKHHVAPVSPGTRLCATSPQRACASTVRSYNTPENVKRVLMSERGAGK